MLLPSDFQFSQSCLQDYVDCPYRFLLRHLKKIAWPALEAEPVQENEQNMQRGALFHSLVQQHLLGIPVDSLTGLAQEEAMNRWWQAYLSSIPASLHGARYPELALSAPFESHRLLAKYDLVLILPEGGAVIYDWKTNARKNRRQWLLARLQTRVYPFLLVQASAYLNDGQPFRPDQIEMVYWFAEAPGEPERIPYSVDQYRQDGQYLSNLASEIASLTEENFAVTPHEERCLFCTYRSLCARGVTAGRLDGLQETEAATANPEDFSFEQIAEIAF